MSKKTNEELIDELKGELKNVRKILSVEANNAPPNDQEILNHQTRESEINEELKRLEKCERNKGVRTKENTCSMLGWLRGGGTKKSIKRNKKKKRAKTVKHGKKTAKHGKKTTRRGRKKTARRGKKTARRGTKKRK